LLPRAMGGRSMTLEALPPLPAAGLERHLSSGVCVAETAPWPGALDALWAVLVAALAFLLASTPARNSDLWLHLASGRSIVQGQTPRGTDPFASTTAGVFWVNHTWLSDIVFYQLYKLGDGWALVFSKCVLMTALAGVMFCFRRRGTRAGILPV